VEAFGPLNGYEAYASPGKPWCVFGRVNEEDGLGLTVYVGKRGQIKGVVVYDRAAECQVMAVVGKVPKSARKAPEA